MIKYISFIFFVFSLGCQVRKFDREYELHKYLQNVHGLENLNNVNVILYLNNYCTSCSESTFMELISNIQRHNSKTYLILSTMDSTLINRFIQDQSIKVIVDKNYEIEKYGLTQASNLIFRFQNDKIKFWDYINTNSISKIKTRIH